jgi:hypothetical protein
VQGDVPPRLAANVVQIRAGRIVVEESLGAPVVETTPGAELVEGHAESNTSETQE